MDQASGEPEESQLKNKMHFLFQKCSLCGVPPSGDPGVPGSEHDAECEAGAESHVCGPQTRHVARARGHAPIRRQKQVNNQSFVMKNILLYLSEALKSRP